MKKIRASIAKEFLLFKRDPPGIVLLFVMPALLIIIMSLIQDVPYKDYQDLKFDVLLVDNDQGKLSNEIINGLEQTKNFNLIKSIDNTPLTNQSLLELIKNGKYKLGIIIPPNATAEINNSANKIANNLALKLGIGQLPERESRSETVINLFFDPIAKPTFRKSVSFALDRIVSASCTKILMHRIAQLSKNTNTDTTKTNDSLFLKLLQGISVKESKIGGAYFVSNINSVQHNVPAWAIFGLFFIVVPIATHLIKEREEGSAQRLTLIPFAQNYIAIGKIIFYTLIGVFQFWMMLAIGKWLLPYFGLPSLGFGNHLSALFLITIALSIAATSYGFFIGSVFETINQSSPFGAISILILAALGGLLVPVDLLPVLMQKLAILSPLYWGMTGVQNVLLRNQGFHSIVLPIIVLLIFSVFFGVAGRFWSFKKGH